MEIKSLKLTVDEIVKCKNCKFCRRRINWECLFDLIDFKVLTFYKYNCLLSNSNKFYDYKMLFDIYYPKCPLIFKNHTDKETIDVIVRNIEEIIMELKDTQGGEPCFEHKTLTTAKALLLKYKDLLIKNNSEGY